MYPNILDCMWCIPIYWMHYYKQAIILRAGLLYMTQFIGWTTTHKPLNLKDWPLYMTQYIWSYSFAAQSKLMPIMWPHQWSHVIPCDTLWSSVGALSVSQTNQKLASYSSAKYLWFMTGATGLQQGTIGCHRVSQGSQGITWDHWWGHMMNTGTPEHVKYDLYNDMWAY